MPARTVRCLFSNQTDFPLNRVSDGLDHGEYTDPWFPPLVINPGQIGEWRSESSGIMTGTEGSARYSIGVPDQNNGHQEFIDVHWDNPYVGGNSASISVTNDFSNTPSTDINSGSFIQSGGPPPNAVKVAGMDVEAWLDTLLFPPYIVANAVSYNDTNAFFGIKMGSQPQFIGDFPGPATGKQTQKLNTDGKPAEWVGQWFGDKVSVTITNSSGSHMTANITDQSANPVLQFSQDFDLKGLTWVATHTLVSAVNTHLSAGSQPVAKAFLVAASEAIRGVGNTGQDSPSVIAERFSKTALVNAEKANTRVSPTRVSKAAEAVSTFVAQSRATVSLMNGVYLTLYDVYIGNAKHSEVLHWREYP